MPFPWKKLFPDIIYFRIKRSKGSDRTQSTSGDIEGHASAPPGITNGFPGLTTPDLSLSLFQQRVLTPSGCSQYCAQPTISLRQSCLGWQPLQGSFQVPVHYKRLSVDCCSSSGYRRESSVGYNEFFKLIWRGIIERSAEHTRHRWPGIATRGTTELPG